MLNHRGGRVGRSELVVSAMDVLLVEWVMLHGSHSVLIVDGKAMLSLKALNLSLTNVMAGKELIGLVASHWVMCVAMSGHLLTLANLKLLWLLKVHAKTVT